MGGVAVVTANLGSFDVQKPNVAQSVDCDFFNITDDNFPPRSNSMTPRLQARIVKTHMWQFVPGYDYYLWVDSSCRLADEDSVKWFMEQLGDKDIAVFRHPHRETIADEANYLKLRLSIGCPYITPRYENELIDEQLDEVNVGEELLASTAFIYRLSPKIKKTMQDWWYHISRYHSIDQLSLPHCLVENKCDVGVIEDNYLKVKALEYVRNK